MKFLNFIYLIFMYIILPKIDYAQTNPNIEKESKSDSSKYYFSKFLNGRVYMKNGIFSDASLNYYIPESIVAYKDSNNTILFLSDIENIDSVNISSFTYIQLQSKFYEIVQNLGDNKYVLALYKGYGHPIADIGRDSISHNNELASNNLTSIYVRKNYQYSTSLGLIYIYEFWDGKKLYKINSLKDLYKLFPDKKEALTQYVDLNKLKLNNITSATKIFEKLSQL